MLESEEEVAGCQIRGRDMLEQSAEPRFFSFLK
jgi:hypothetical protein